MEMPIAISHSSVIIFYLYDKVGSFYCSEMDKVSSLAGVFRVFELFGVQQFSLDGKAKSESKRQKMLSVIHLIIVWGLGSLSMAVLTYYRIEDYRNSEENNKLSYLMRLVSLNLTLASVYVNLVTSRTHNVHFVKIFENAEGISKLALREFGHRVNYKELIRGLKCVLGLFVGFYALVMVYLVIQFILMDAFSIKELLFYCWLLIPNIVVSIGLVKYNFYVQIVNFHLRNLQNLIKNEFSRPEPFQVTAICVISVRESNRQKSNQIMAMRKIFWFIKDNTDRINDSMGYLILAIIFLVFIRLVTSVYSFILLINGNSASDNLASECFF